MDYGFLDIGRDEANQLLCLFLLKNGLDFGFFCMGKVGDVQCNIEVEMLHVFRNLPVEAGFFVK